MVFGAIFSDRNILGINDGYCDNGGQHHKTCLALARSPLLLISWCYIVLAVYRKQLITYSIRILDQQWYMNSISSFSTFLELFLRRYMFLFCSVFDPVRYVIFFTQLRKKHNKYTLGVFLFRLLNLYLLDMTLTMFGLA